MEKRTLIANWTNVIKHPETDRHRRFLVYTTVLAVLFVGVSTLSSANPFNLLLPGFSYPEVKVDQRELKEVYGVFENVADPLPLKRRILLAPDDSRLLVQKLAFTLSEPLSYEENKEVASLGNYKTLPSFGYAIRSSWIKGNVLIVDFRSETLDKELHKYLDDRSENKTAEDNLLLAGFFKAYSMSLFAQMKEIQEIRFLLDGETSSGPTAVFPIDQPITRDILKPSVS